MTTAQEQWDDWGQYGSCRQAEPEAFFPEVGRPATIAKRVCNGDAKSDGCIVRDQCLRWALGVEGNPWEEWGVWGGMSRRERMKERRRLGLSIEQPPAFREHNEGPGGDEEIAS